MSICIMLESMSVECFQMISTYLTFYLSTYLHTIYLIYLTHYLSNLYIRRKEKGPINFQAMVHQSILTTEMVLRICREYRIMSCDIFCRCDATIDELIDVIEGNRSYIPCIYVLNKIDQLTIEELDIIDQMPHHIPICAA